MIFWFLLLFGGLVSNSNIEKNRVCEVTFWKVYIDSTKESPNQAGTLDTGLVVTSDDKYLYIITLNNYARDKVIFAWTKEVRTFYDDKQSKNDIEIEGELLGRSLIYDLALFRAPKPKNYEFKLCKFAEPTDEESLILAVKNYYVLNRVNLYFLKEGYFINKYEIHDNNNKEIYVRYADGPPKGGGIIFNKEGAIVGIIHFWLPDENCVVAISGKTIEQFIKDLRDKDKAPPAPKEEKSE